MIAVCLAAGMAAPALADVSREPVLVQMPPEPPQQVPVAGIERTNQLLGAIYDVLERDYLLKAAANNRLLEERIKAENEQQESLTYGLYLVGALIVVIFVLCSMVAALFSKRRQRLDLSTRGFTGTEP